MLSRSNSSHFSRKMPMRADYQCGRLQRATRTSPEAEEKFQKTGNTQRTRPFLMAVIVSSKPLCATQLNTASCCDLALSSACFIIQNYKAGAGSLEKLEVPKLDAHTKGFSRCDVSRENVAKFFAFLSSGFMPQISIIEIH